LKREERISALASIELGEAQSNLSAEEEEKAETAEGDQDGAARSTEGASAPDDADEFFRT
jgi:hypothetical protein